MFKKFSNLFKSKYKKTQQTIVKIRKSSKDIQDVEHTDKKLWINRETILPRVTIEEFIGAPQTVEYEHVPEVYFDVLQHPSSILSKSKDESAFYVNHSVRAPEMMLERLQDQYWFPESGFIISDEGVVWRHSILGQFADPNFLTTYAVKNRKSKDSKDEYFYWPHLLSNAPKISGLKMIATHYASHNYGHFLLDMVPLLDFASKHSIDLIVRPLTDWQKSFFELYNIKAEKILECSERAYKLDDCIVSNRHNAVSTYCASPNHRKVYSDLLDRIKTKYPNVVSKKFPKRIFLSRSDAKTRILKNRDEVENILKNEGFTVIHPQEYSIPEQAVLFNSAEIIVSEFGAIMANVAFCRRGTKIIEIIPSNQKDPWSVHLCSALELDYLVHFQEIIPNATKSVVIGDKNIDNIYFEYRCNIAKLLSAIRTIDTLKLDCIAK